MVDVATPLPDTANRMLDVAERLVQQRGFNAFSYADIAAELGVTKATLHYHFASKAALGSAVIDRYALRFFDALAAIDARGGSPEERLAGFVEVYADVLRDQRMCLCGMLAADQLTLRMRSDVCQGNPVATVTIDSLPSQTIDVGATAYTDYNLSLNGANGGAAGTHTLKVEFLNNFKTSNGSCDRNLYLDKVTVRQVGS